MATVAAFAAACKDRTHAEIYTMFEYGISEELRNEIYSLDPAHLESNEPCRAAMIELGTRFNVQSLIDY